MKFLIYKKPSSCKNKTIRQKHEWPPYSTSVISSHHLRDPSFLIDSFGTHSHFKYHQWAQVIVEIVDVTSTEIL